MPFDCIPNRWEPPEPPEPTWLTVAVYAWTVVTPLAAWALIGFWLGR